jgi:hypothetical protein
MVQPARNAFAFLAGFLLCYVVGVALMFHFLVTIGYSWQMAIPRSVLWFWTARVGTDMVAEGIVQGTVKIKKPECDNPRVTWC